MKKRLLRPVTLLILTAAALSLTAWAIASAPRQSPQAAQTDETKRKTLRDIARERDVELVSHSEDEAEYADLRSLARDAEAIVVGRVTTAEAAFDGDNAIVTNYSVEVERVVKDTKLNAPLKAGQPQPAPLVTPLKLVRAGGEVSVNGHRASQRFEGESLAAGGEYVLFLWWSPSSNAYYLAGGSSGGVLVRDGRVEPLGKSAKPKFAGRGLESFLSEVLQ